MKRRYAMTRPESQTVLHGIQCADCLLLHDDSTCKAASNVEPPIQRVPVSYFVFDKTIIMF